MRASWWLLVFISFTSFHLGYSVSITSPSLATPIKSSDESASDPAYPYDLKIYLAGERELTMNCLSIPPNQLLSPDIQAMKENLFHVLHKFRAQNGFGRAIAAPQLGYPFRMIALHYNNTDTLLYNPSIIHHSLETFTMWDDCLSFPDKMCCIRRYKSITVQFVNEKNQFVLWENCSQDLSELLQHEIDHLNGVLAIDKAEKPRLPATRRRRSIGEVTDSVDERERKQEEEKTRFSEQIPDAIVPRADWLQRKDFYNEFVDFHY